MRIFTAFLLLFCAASAFAGPNIFVVGDSRVEVLSEAIVATPPIEDATMLVTGQEDKYNGKALENWALGRGTGTCTSDTEFYGCIEKADADYGIDIIWIWALGFNDFLCWDIESVCQPMFGYSGSYADMAAYLAAWRDFYETLHIDFPNALIIQGTGYPIRLNATDRETCGVNYGGPTEPIVEPDCVGFEACIQETNGMLRGFHDLLMAANNDLSFVVYHDSFEEIATLMGDDLNVWFDSFVPVADPDDCIHMPDTEYGRFCSEFLKPEFDRLSQPICSEANYGIHWCVECLVDEDCPNGACIQVPETETTEEDTVGVCMAECLSDNDCDDNMFCNGLEQCEAGVCGPGEPPLCPSDTPVCDEDMDQCVECLDDGDCFAADECISGWCASRFIQIDKFRVKAGNSSGTDSLKFSGLIDADEGDFAAAMGGYDVIITVEADLIPDLDKTTYTFQITHESFSKGKYKSPKAVLADKTDPVTWFALDTIKGTMKFSGKNLDLTGLSCPVTVRIQIGDYIAATELCEDIVNGEKKPAPLSLLMGVKDSLDAKKVKASKKARLGSDSISIAGTFTVNGLFKDDQPVVITIGSDTFTVPGSQFVLSKGTYSCKGYGGSISAKFDTVQCAYSIKIQNTTLSDSGDVDFGINLFDNDLQSSNQITLSVDP